MVLLCQWLCHLCGELWYHTRAKGFTYVSFTHTHTHTHLPFACRCFGGDRASCYAVGVFPGMHAPLILTHAVSPALHPSPFLGCSCVMQVSVEAVLPTDNINFTEHGMSPCFAWFPSVQCFQWLAFSALSACSVSAFKA
jgi:hypothetical protein